MTAEHSAALAGRDKSETVNTTRTAVQDLPGNESRKADSVGLPGTKWTPHPSRKSNRRSRRFMRKLEKLLHPNKEKRRRPSNATPNSNRSLKLDETSDDESSQDEAVHSVCTRPCIKIRLATFNMHESLPSGGDLGDFLGDLSEANFGKQGRSNSSASSNRRRHVKQEFDQDRRWSTTSRSSTTAVDESLPVLPLDERHPYHLLVIAGQECPTASGVLAGKVRTLDGRGWTTVLEEYLCGVRPEDLESRRNDMDAEEQRPPDARTEQESFVEGGHRGPYVLVEKLRLMGIYLAVFVLRRSQHLISGVSTSRVTAGLIGGRVGNKGGVGISICFAGSRLLFVSAHLAAHAHAVDVRKANIRKIFNELDLDDFSGSSDTGRDLTDRFDQTFFMGDLNFRLNITRKHADWLLKSKDYSNALQFDQLREVLAERDGPFAGFSEGPISFAPTYKYDVPGRARRKRTALYDGDKALKRGPREWTSYEPADVDQGSVTDPEVLQATRDGKAGETIAVLSDRDSIESGLSDYDRIDKDEVLPTPAGIPGSPPKGNPTPVDAMRKADHVRFRNLVRNSSAAARIISAAKEASTTGGDSSPNAPARKLSINDIPATRFLRPILRSAHSEVIVPLARSAGSDTPYSSAVHSEDEDVEHGLPASGEDAIFDTSSKQRVQSYTDRILFKSTVPVEEETGELDPPDVGKGSIVANTIREIFSGFGSSASTTLHKSKSVTVDQALAEKATVKLKRWQSEAASRQGDQRSPSRASPPFVEMLKPPAISSAAESPDPGTAGVKRSRSMRERGSKVLSRNASVKTTKSQDRVLTLRETRRTSADELGRRPASLTKNDPGTVRGIARAEDKDATIRPKRAAKRPTFLLRSSSSSQSFPDTNSLQLANTSSARTEPLAPVVMVGGPTTHDLPRSLTQASNRSVSGPTSPDVGFERIRSFFHLPSLSFLKSRPEDDFGSARPVIEGPRRGEIQILKYDAVTDLTKMGAVSDHRPVYAVAAIGVSGRPVSTRARS